MKATAHRHFHFAFSGLLMVTLAACGGGGGYGGGGGSVTYTIGGTVTGLAGSGLVLRNNGVGDLAVSADGAFTFATGLANGAAYAVTVMTQPSSPAQNCIVTNGSGTVGTANVSNVTVSCSTLATHTVGGTVTGLTGSGMELDYFDTVNPPVPLSVSVDGAFIFPVAVVEGSTYQVTLAAQPTSPTQNCIVINGTGVIATANVTDVSVACSDVGRFAYVSNAGDDTISETAIDSTTGALTTIGTVATGASPYAISGSPDKQHVYVVNQVSNNISAYAVNTTSGTLTQIAGSPFPAGTDPQALVFDPSGAHLYVANYGSNDLSAYAVDAGTGALTPLSVATYATGAGPSDVAVDSAGKFVFVANNGGSSDISVFAITAGTGELTPVAGSPFPASTSPDNSPLSLVYVDSEQVLYVTTSALFLGPGLSTFRVDHVTGALSLLRQPTVTADHYIAADRNGGCLYVTTGASVVGYGIGDAGELITLPDFPVAAGTDAYSVAVDPSNQFVYVGNDGAGTVSGFKRSGCGLTAIGGAPFATGSHPDFVAIL